MNVEISSYDESKKTRACNCPLNLLSLCTEHESRFFLAESVSEAGKFGWMERKSRVQPVLSSLWQICITHDLIRTSYLTTRRFGH